MSDQVASLVVVVDAADAKRAAVDLDALAKSAGRADASSEKLTGTSRKLSDAEQAVANEAQRAMEGVSRLAAEQEAAVKTAHRLNTAHGAAIINTKALNQSTLNLGRQFTDLGVQIGGGANPLIALMQQLPQITDGLAMAKTQGISAGQAFQALYASVVPIAAPILAIGAAAGAAFGLFERAIDQNTKHATSWGDTWRATVKVVGDNIMDGPIGDALKWLGGAFSKTLDFIVDGVTGWYDRTVGLFIAAYKTITTHWKDLPAAFGAIMVGAANGVISGIQFIVDGALGAVNYFRKKAGMDEFARVELPKLTQANNAAARDFEKYWKDATASVRKSREDFADNVARQADREYEKHQKAAKATQKAVEDHTKAIKLNTDTVAAANVVDLEALRIAAAFEAQQKSLKTAANDNIRTFDAAGVSIPTALENMATEAERVAYQTRDIVYGVEDIADAINRNDWTSAFSSLARVLVQVQNAFKAGASAADKFAAAAALAQGVGNIVGGSTGSAISGAASGALAGATFGVPGAIIGGAVGLVGSLFGSSKAKKQQRAQEAAQRAAEEAARQQQISDTTFSLNVALLEAQGKAEEALAMTRQRELDALAKLDPALVSLQQQLYAAEDAASAAAKAQEEAAKAQALAAQARDLDIQLMEATGNVAGALAARREIEVAALDESLRATQLAIYAANDLNASRAEEARIAQEAAQKAEARAAEVASAQASIYDRIDQLTKTSAELMYAGRRKELDAADALDASLGPLLVKLYGLEDAAAASAKAAEEAAAAEALREEAIQRSLAFQQTNIGLMRQLMAMDDAVTGATSARDAMRADELAKLDETGQYLQKIIWAREDEQKVIDANTAALERENARRAELTNRQTSIQDEIDKLTLSSSDLLLKTRAKERAEAVAFDASLGPLLDSLFALQDAASATAAANEAAATSAAAAAQAAAEAAERAAQLTQRQGAIQDQIDQLTLSSADLLLKTRAKERAEAVAFDASLGALLDSLYAVQDATKAASEAMEAEAARLARAKEVADYQAAIQDRIDELTLSSSDLLLKTRNKEMVAAAAYSDAAVQLLRQLYDLEDASKAAAAAAQAQAQAQQAAAEAMAEAQRQAEEAAQRAAETYAARMSKTGDLLAASGQTALATLFQRARELSQIVDPVSRALQLQIYAAQDLADQIGSARDTLTASYERESGAIEAFRDKLVGVGDSLRSYSASLGSTLSGSGSASSQRAQAEAAFRDIVTRYQQGDVSLAGQIPALGEAFAKASQAASKDQLSYLRDIAYIKSETDQAASKVDSQVTIAQQQLDQLKAQVNGLLSVETATVSVAQAVTNLTELIRQTTYGQDARAQAIQDQINGMQSPFSLIWTLLGSKAALAAGLPQYTGANDNIPGFATGGVFTNGIVSQPTMFNMAQMGEAGSEAIVPLVRGPEGLGVRMSGGGNAELVAELRALRQEVAELKAAQIQTTINTGRQVRLAERWDGDGLPPERDAA